MAPPVGTHAAPAIKKGQKRTATKSNTCTSPGSRATVTTNVFVLICLVKGNSTPKSAPTQHQNHLLGSISVRRLQSATKTDKRQRSRPESTLGAPKILNEFEHWWQRNAAHPVLKRVKCLFYENMDEEVCSVWCSNLCRLYRVAG